MTTRLRIGIIGAGHFGRFHAQKVAAATRAILAGIHDPDAARAALVAAETTTVARPLEALLAASDAVVIAAPAHLHHRLAMTALDAGKHVLVEKPIAASLAEADEMAALATAKGLVLQVGHLLRYSAEYQAISARMPRPVYIECVRIAPFKTRGTDVSVILDLMIHDIDLVLALVDSPVVGVDAIGTRVASAHEDIANARLRFANGCVATIVASRVSLRTERRMRLFGQDAYLAVDFATRKLTAIRRGHGTPIPLLDGAGMEEVSWEEHDALAAEHTAFAAAILDGATILVDAQAGRRALDVALRVTASMEAARAVAEASGLLAAAPPPRPPV